MADDLISAALEAGSLAEDDWDGGEIDRSQPAGPAIRAHNPVQITPSAFDVSTPGFVHNDELPTKAMSNAWNRMLGIIRGVAETPAELQPARVQMAREFYAEAVEATRAMRKERSL